MNAKFKIGDTVRTITGNIGEIVSIRTGLRSFLEGPEYRVRREIGSMTITEPYYSYELEKLRY